MEIIPHIQNFSLNLRQITFFSIINLIRTFHRIPVASDDIFKTAITVAFGLYELVRMPYGLQKFPNDTISFQRCMDEVNKNLSFVVVYNFVSRDDVLD